MGIYSGGTEYFCFRKEGHLSQVAHFETVWSGGGLGDCSLKGKRVVS